MALLTHRLDLFFVDAYCFIFWDLPRDVLVAPESALCGWIGVLLSLSLSLSQARAREPCALSAPDTSAQCSFRAD